jgi:hypothetical protein
MGAYFAISGTITVNEACTLTVAAEFLNESGLDGELVDDQFEMHFGDSTSLGHCSEACRLLEAFCRIYAVDGAGFALENDGERWVEYFGPNEQACIEAEIADLQRDIICSQDAIAALQLKLRLLTGDEHYGN